MYVFLRSLSWFTQPLSQFPNSYHNQTGGTPGFLPSAAEAPMQLANHVLSRIGHYFHEGKPSEHDQVRELYRRVLSEKERENLHHNTARLLKVSTTSTL